MINSQLLTRYAAKSITASTAVARGYSNKSGHFNRYIQKQRQQLLKHKNNNNNNKRRLLSSDASKKDTQVKEFQDEMIVVSSTTRMYNLALACGLVGFVGGVFMYSVRAVGQATVNTDDPLDRLKQEAQEAYDKEEKEKEAAKMDADTQNLLAEFQRGDLDPDKIDDEEEVEEEKGKKKRSLLNRIIFFWR